MGNCFSDEVDRADWNVWEDSSSQAQNEHKKRKEDSEGNQI